MYHIYSSLTMLWICLGGLAQTITAIYFIQKRDLGLFSWCGKVLVVALLLILLGPVMVNVFGAVCIIRNKGKADFNQRLKGKENYQIKFGHLESFLDYFSLTCASSLYAHILLYPYPITHTPPGLEF